MNKKVLAVTLMTVAMLALQISKVYATKPANAPATMSLRARSLTVTSEIDGDIDISWVPKDTSEYLLIPDAIPTDPSYFLWDGWGGTWCDAEKQPPDDGVGNPDPYNYGDEDDLLCWAATASNILEWTGWGLVSGMWDSDQMFTVFIDHWYDDGGRGQWGWHWWFDGNTPPSGSYVDVPGAGDYWDPPYHFGDYWTQNENPGQALQAIDTYLHAGRGVYLSVNGHAITCWGFSYDSTNANYYTGIYVSDSDDDKGSYPPAPNTLRYYQVQYNSGDDRWYLQNYYGTNVRYIHRVEGLLHFPSTRPVADAGGPYTGNEGSAITFDGSGSSDADGDTLQYRWDFDNDGVWDTGWSGPTASHTWYEDYTGTVVLQVYDGHMLDIDSDTVTVSNAAPTVSAGPDQTVDEGDTVSFSGSYTDPGTSDIHTIEWDFGDGSPVVTGTLTPTHVYADNGDYTVTLTVTDDDGGVGTDTLMVTVYNVAPTVDAGPDQTVYSGDTVSFSGSFTDPGIVDTFTIEWDFGDGTPKATGTLTPTHVYLVAQIYTVTLTVTDDDGGVGVDTLTVTVNRIPVPIDIKPGSYPNSISPDDNGLIPVAILNDASWTPYYIDPTLVDPSSAVFGPNKASTVRWAYEDVDLDGDIDLILFFKTRETGIKKGDTTATLSANLIDGRQITGVDSVLTAPRRKS